MREAGFRFEVKTKEVEESYPKHLPPEQVAEYLSEKKATAAKEFMQGGEIILAADSLVVLGNSIFGKPVDYEDAVRILQALSGNIHRVITGFCLLSEKKKFVGSAISKVKFEKFTRQEIDFYIENYQPYDKAGAYAIQEWIGLCKASKIEGLYSNIMGLPMELVYRALKDFG